VGPDEDLGVLPIYITFIGIDRVNDPETVSRDGNDGRLKSLH
jgi:hypothetical protein